MRFTNARCDYCGRLLRRAWIPNRGWVMAHNTGERELCNRLRAFGRDLVSRGIDIKGGKK